MSDREVASAVEVPVEPQTAFAVFTEEIDLWWKRGPISHWDGGRAVAMRIEPGVGGRLLEVYADSDPLVLGRITVWEPGERLSFDSALDDVHTDITFQPSPGGTLVRVVATIPTEGRDTGGTAWVRVTAKWYGPWCGQRDRAPREVRDIAKLALAVSYARPVSAARWLADTLGLDPVDPLPERDEPASGDPHGDPWLELRVGNCSLMLVRLDDRAGTGGQRHLPWIYVDDVAEHYQRVQASGAPIVEELASPWGLPFYVVADPEGNHWRVVQARPTMR